MPELPEVETTRKGISAAILNQTVKSVIVRDYRLRWLIPKSLEQQLPRQTITQINRRGKYLLLQTATHCLIIHLGMSGHLRIVKQDTPVTKHDHVDIVFNNKLALRYNDPRRFGAVLWTDQDPLKHERLRNLGVEPLDDEFNAQHLYDNSRSRSIAVKSFIMDGKLVVGVGNIYACESLFMAGIDPRKAANKISMKRYERLCEAIKSVLTKAIKAGGTTLQDFKNSDGKPGYFAQELKVYGRAGEPCGVCGRKIKSLVIAQRNTFWCSGCQR